MFNFLFKNYDTFVFIFYSLNIRQDKHFKDQSFKIFKSTITSTLILLPNILNILHLN